MNEDVTGEQELHSRKALICITTVANRSRCRPTRLTPEGERWEITQGITFCGGGIKNGGANELDLEGSQHNEGPSRYKLSLVSLK